MCHQSCIDFVRRVLTKEDIEGKKIIEVGSLDVNGSVRPYIETFKPRQYIGVDIAIGPGVDEICDAKDIAERYGRESFDVVITTELLEHVKDWRKVINNLKDIVIPNGIILITTRSKGFGYHGFPSDYWRFEKDDMKYIFSDFVIKQLEKDPLASGIFVKAKKPQYFSKVELSNYVLYSIIARRKTIRINESFHVMFEVAVKIIRKILPSPIKSIIAKYLYVRKDN